MNVNIISKLNYYLLKNILNYVANVDRICFTLICKKLYKERSHYLIFNSLEYPYYYLDLKHIYGSYTDTIVRSIETEEAVANRVHNHNSIFIDNDSPYLLASAIGIQISDNKSNNKNNNNSNNNIRYILKYFDHDTTQYIWLQNDEMLPLPHNIKHLKLPNNNNYNVNISALSNISSTALESLESIEIGAGYWSEDPINPIVKEGGCKLLKSIHFGGFYEKMKEGTIPPSVKTITIVSEFLIQNPIDTIPMTVSTIIMTLKEVRDKVRIITLRRLNSNYFIVFGKGRRGLTCGVVLNSRLNYKDQIDNILKFD